MTTRILAVGECMAELSPQDAPDSYRLGFAGDTFNTAWYLARLGGTEVAYLTAVGDDALSGRMRDVMADSGIGTRHVRVVAGGTVGLYLISLKDGERSFSYWRGQSAARRLADDPAALAAAMAGADVIYLSGITLAILEPGPRAVLVDALRAARRAGRTVAFDPNLRPRLWPDAAAMTSAVMEAASASDIALPSFEDEARWFGDADPDATADRYASAGVGTVVVKNGEGAVRHLSDGARGAVAVAPVAEVVDTTAAGDAFNAGLLSALAAGAPLPEAIGRGCRLAGRVVRGRGALVPVDAAGL